MIRNMNDLPDPPLRSVSPSVTQGFAGQVTPYVVGPGNVSTGGGGNKEAESGGGRGELPLKEVAAVEIELPQEVVQAGVKVQQTQIQVPQQITQSGVQVTGVATISQGQTVVLPLTDEQIAKGLHASVTASLRWLTEWCIRRMKQIMGKTRAAKITNHKTQ